MPVLDRYNVVLQIFQKHSQTKEAKLQVSLAEIQYMMVRLNEDWAIESVSKHSNQRLGEDHFEKQDMLLKRRKAKITKSVSKPLKARDSRAADSTGNLIAAFQSGGSTGPPSPTAKGPAPADRSRGRLHQLRQNVAHQGQSRGFVAFLEL